MPDGPHDWKVNDIVEHPEYGQGRIVSVNSERATSMLEIEFRQRYIRYLNPIGAEAQKVSGHSKNDDDWRIGDIFRSRFCGQGEVVSFYEDMLGVQFTSWVKRRLPASS